MHPIETNSVARPEKAHATLRELKIKRIPGISMAQGQSRYRGQRGRRNNKEIHWRSGGAGLCGAAPGFCSDYHMAVTAAEAQEIKKPATSGLRNISSRRDPMPTTGDQRAA
jgi:hypothetical protein